MTRQLKTGHNQWQILAALYDYSKRYPDQWVPRYRLINDLKMGDTTFSQAIQQLVEPHDGENHFDSLVEITYPSIAYREYQGGVVPLPDNATMSDALFAMKFAWDSNHGRRHFYRITELGVKHLDSLTSRNRLKSAQQGHPGYDPEQDSLTQAIKANH